MLRAGFLIGTENPVQDTGQMRKNLLVFSFLFLGNGFCIAVRMACLADTELMLVALWIDGATRANWDKHKEAWCSEWSFSVGGDHLGFPPLLFSLDMSFHLVVPQFSLSGAAVETFVNHFQIYKSKELCGCNNDCKKRRAWRLRESWQCMKVLPEWESAECFVYLSLVMNAFNWAFYVACALLPPPASHCPPWRCGKKPFN